MSPEDSTSSIGAKAYYETLGNYHSWFLRQGAYIAMNFLPTKKTLLVSVSILLLVTKITFMNM